METPHKILSSQSLQPLDRPLGYNKEAIGIPPLKIGTPNNLPSEGTAHKEKPLTSGGQIPAPPTEGGNEMHKVSSHGSHPNNPASSSSENAEGDAHGWGDTKIYELFQEAMFKRL
jgi:hypothetical protein